jgi:DinB family protein
MELRQTLIAISNDARGWLRAWSRDFTEREAAENGPGDGRPNPLAWQLGHLACVEDEVCQLFGADGSVVPAGLRAVCTTGAPQPPPDTTYPSLPDLWALLERTHRGVLELVERATPEDLDRPPRTPNKFFTSLGQAVYEAALHENYHVGEIGALRKALGKPRIG